MIADTMRFREKGHKIAYAIKFTRIRDRGKRKIAAKIGRGTVQPISIKLGT